MSDGDDSDALGTIAEDIFKAMARRARLFASSLSPDRTGKDIVLEERLASADGVSFDKRPGPRICVVQVKATQGAKAKATVKLSAAERLAKEPNAAAIVVLRLNSAEECADAYLIHMHGKRLDAVLRKLRSETKRGTKDLHKREITFTATKAERFEWSAAGLHEAFVRLFPSSTEKYVADKAGRVATTGYAADRYLLNFTVDGTAEDLTEGFLGLRKLPVRSVEVFERRFDIDLPAPSDQFGAPGLVEITPQPREAGVLILTDADTGERLDIPCEVIVPPAPLMSLEEMRVLFRWRMGSFLMASNEWKFRPSTKCAADSENTVSDWLLYVRTMDMLERRRIDIKYVGAKGELSFSGRDRTDHTKSNNYSSVIHTLREIERLLTEAGGAQEPTSLTALWEQRRVVETIGMLQERHVKFTLETGPMPFPAFSSERGLHVGAAEIGRTWVAVAMPLLVSTKAVDEGVEWIGYRSGPAVLEALPDGGEMTFTRFRERVQKLASVPLVFFQQPGSYLGEVTAVVTDGIEEKYGRKSLSNDTSDT